MKTIGERIRQAREFRGLTGEGLASLVGYKNQSAIGNLENRATGRGGYQLPKIAAALDVPLDWLLNGPDSLDLATIAGRWNTVKEPAPAYKADPRQHAVILLEQLSDTGIAKAIEHLELLQAKYPRHSIRAGHSVPARARRAA